MLSTNGENTVLEMHCSKPMGKQVNSPKVGGIFDRVTYTVTKSIIVTRI